MFPVKWSGNNTTWSTYDIHFKPVIILLCTLSIAAIGILQNSCQVFYLHTNQSVLWSIRRGSVMKVSLTTGNITCYRCFLCFSLKPILCSPLRGIYKTNHKMKNCHSRCCRVWFCNLKDVLKLRRGVYQRYFYSWPACLFSLAMHWINSVNTL